MSRIYEVLETIDCEAFQYPRYCGNGVYEVARGVFGGENLVEELNRAILEEVRKK